MTLSCAIAESPLDSLRDVPAPAKLNLFLHVVGRRADGYHLLESLFVLIDWCDRLHFERRSDGQLTRRDIGAALPADDLCLRAAGALQQASGCRFGADITIEKHVPWGAGLGGGSSDAATTLYALNRLWALHWPRQRLLALAPELGADVPFFLGGCNALVEGIGERLTPVEMRPTRFAIVKPAASLETRHVFASPLVGRSGATAILLGFPVEHTAHRSLVLDRVDWNAHWRSGHNDLQAAAQSVCPVVADAADWLQLRFGNSRMTGSGSAVFAEVVANDQVRNRSVEDPFEAASSAVFSESLPAGWTGRICQSLAEHPLKQWAPD